MIPSYLSKMITNRDDWSDGSDFILQLDDWVLCRIYNKKGSIEKQQAIQNAFSRKSEYSSGMEEDKKPEILIHGGALPPPPPPPSATAAMTDYMYFDTSDSIPKLHTDSSCSEHVVSPEFASEVQSEPKWNEWEKNLEFPYNYIDATMGNSSNQMSPLQDMFMYLQKPFWRREEKRIEASVDPYCDTWAVGALHGITRQKVHECACACA